MTRLSPITIDRLKQLPRVAAVWEGDRRPMQGLADGDLAPWGRQQEKSDCIVWLDSSQGTVRSISLVPSTSGYEPIVRTLLQAIEAPQGSLPPVRPQKLVVCDREIQFYLRGALQDLGITVDYVPRLPLVDDLFEALRQPRDLREADLPDRYSDAMVRKALEIWELAPWHSLNEQQILAVEIKNWDIDTLYISTLGMGGVEYGLLMYRSLESLQQFRQRVLRGEHSPKQMQEAFLEQDCLFLNFELFEDEPAPPGRSLAPDVVEPDFGSIHPLEGMRGQLAESEGATFLVALEAVRRFFGRYRDQLERPPYPKIKGTYRIANPEKPNGSTLAITVRTLPEVTTDLMAATEEALASGSSPAGLLPTLRDDYIPEGSIIALTRLEADWLSWLRKDPAITYQPRRQPLQLSNAALPVVLIQTSRPKAKTLLGQLQRAQGVEAVCFNPGGDPFSGETFELGLLQTGDGAMHLFGEYTPSNPKDQETLKRWEQWQAENQGACAVVIATGITGQAKGKPSLKNIVGVFEAHYRSPKDLHLPPLLIDYADSWDQD